MKYGYAVKKNGVLYTPGMDVPGDEPIGVEVTDDVPEGALEENPDGSVNAYDQEGNVVGTVPAEEVEKLQEQAGEVFKDQEKAERGKKGKKA